MGISMYQHGRRTRQPRNMAVFLATIAIVGVVVIVAWYIVHKDIAGKTDPKTTIPIVTEVVSSEGDVKKINENYFSMELPADWEFVEHKTGNRINAYIYKSTAKGKNDRMLYVHVDVMPPTYKIVKMQPVYPDGNKLRLGNLSGDCTGFGQHDESSNAEFEAKWENVTFICDPIEANQTIGTGNTTSGISTKLGNHTYFFYFEDHNINPDSIMFRDILQSFIAK